MQQPSPASAQWTSSSSPGCRLSSGLHNSPSDRRYTLSGGGITSNGAGCSVTSPPNLAGGVGGGGSRYMSSAAAGPPPPLVIDRPLSRTVLDGGLGGGGAASLVYLHQNHAAGSQLQQQHRAQQQTKTTMQVGNPPRPEHYSQSPALNLSAASNATEDQPLDLTGGHSRKRRSSGDVIDVDGLSSPDAPTNADDAPLDLSVKRPRGSTLTSASSRFCLVPDTSGFPERRQTFRQVLDRSRMGHQEMYAMHGGGVVSRSPAAADSRYPGIHIAQSPVPLGQLGVSAVGGVHRGSGFVPGRRGGAVPVIHHTALRQPSTSTIVVPTDSSFQPATRTPVYRPGLAYQQRSSAMARPSANSSLQPQTGRPMEGRFVTDALVGIKRMTAEPPTHFRSDYMLQQQQQQMAIPNVSGSAMIDSHRQGRLQSMTSSATRPAGFTGRLIPVERRQPPNGLPPEMINQQRLTTDAFRRRVVAATPAEASVPTHVDPYVTPPPSADKPVMKSTYGKDGWQLNIPRAIGGASNSISGILHDVTFKPAPSDEVISGPISQRSETIDIDSGVDDMYFRGPQPMTGLPAGERRKDDVISCRRGGPSTDLTATATQTNLSISDELKNPPIVIQPIPEMADCNSVGGGGGDAGGLKTESTNSISGGSDSSMLVQREFRGAFDRGVVMSLQGNSGLACATGSASTTPVAGAPVGPPSRRIPIANVQPIMKEPPALVPRPVGCSTVVSTQQPVVVAPDKKDAVGADVVSQRPSLTTMDSELGDSTVAALADDCSSSMKDDIPLLTTSVAGHSSSSSASATVSSAGSTSTTTSTTGTGRQSSHHMEYIKFLRQTVDAGSTSNRGGGGGIGSRGGRIASRSVSTETGARFKLQTSMSTGRRARGKTVLSSSVKARRQLLPQFSADLSQQDGNTEINKQSEDTDVTSAIGGGKPETVSEQQKSESSSSASCSSSSGRKAKTPVVYFDDEDSSTQAATLDESAATAHASTSQTTSGRCDVTGREKTSEVRRAGSKLLRGRGRQRASNGANHSVRRCVGPGGKLLGKGCKAAAADRTKEEENHTGEMSDTTEGETSDIESKDAGRSRDTDVQPPTKRRKRRVEVDVANCKLPGADGDASDDLASRDLHVTGNSSSRRLAVSVSRGGRGHRRQGGVTRGQRGGRSDGHVTYQRHHIGRGGRISHRGAESAHRDGHGEAAQRHQNDDYDFNELDEENGDGDEREAVDGDNNATSISSRSFQGQGLLRSSHCTLRGGRRARPGGFQYPDVFGRRRGRGGTSAGRRLGRRAVDGTAMLSLTAALCDPTGSVDSLSSKHHHCAAEFDVSDQLTVTSHDGHDNETETETGSPTFPPSSFHPLPPSTFNGSSGRHRLQLYTRRRPSLGHAPGRLGSRPRGGGGTGRGRGARAAGAGLGRRGLKAAVAAGQDLEELALRDEPGETPLHKATRLDYEELVYYFLTTGGVPANAQDNEGRTPLHISCSRGNMNITRMLLAFGAHPNCKASDGTRPLHCAVAGNHVTLVRLLLACGADVTSMTSANRSVLQLSRGRAVRQLIHGVLGDLKSSENQLEIPWEFPCSFDKHRSDVFDDVPQSDDETEAEMVFDVSVEQLLPVYRLQAEPNKPYHNYHRVCDVIRHTQVGGVAIGDDDYVILNGDLTFVRSPAPSNNNSSHLSSRDRHNTTAVDPRLPWGRSLPSAADWTPVTGDVTATVTVFVELDSILRDRLDLGSGVRIKCCMDSQLPPRAPSTANLASNIPPSQPQSGSSVINTRLSVTSSCRIPASHDTSTTSSSSSTTLNRSQSSLQPTVVLTPWNSSELCLTNSTNKCGVTSAVDRRRGAAGRRRGTALHLSTSSGLDADHPSGTTVDDHPETAEEHPPPPASTKTSDEESSTVTSSGLDPGRRPGGRDSGIDLSSKISHKSSLVVDVEKTDSGRSSGSGTPSHSSSVTSLLYVQTSVTDPTDETTQPSTPEPSTCSPATEPPTPTIEVISLPVLEKHEGGGDVTTVGGARRTISADVGGLFQLRQAAGEVGNDVIELDAEDDEMKGDKGFVDDDDREMPELTLYA